MADALLVLFDDRRARGWQPFTLTRPAGELRFGASTLRERAERALGLRCAGHISAEHLEGFDEQGAPPVLRGSDLPPDRDVLFWSSRALPDSPPPGDEVPGRAGEGGAAGGPRLLTIGGAPCGYYAPGGRERPEPEFFLDPSAAAPDLPSSEVSGSMLSNVWELIVGNPERTDLDIRESAAGRAGAGMPGARASRSPAGAEAPVLDPELPDGVRRIGDAPLLIAPDAQIEPGVLLDLRSGPIRLDGGTSVRAFTRLAGPSHVAAGSTLLGGNVSAVSIGPGCKVRGEVEETVVLAHTNKAHDGFIGHAYLGAWVNLGALTTNSDLKNNYGPVRIWTPDGVADTGSMKIGCLVGDHVKTAIGKLLNTGTVVGAGSNLFGSGLPPQFVPPFSWADGTALEVHELERFLETARTAMARREVPLTAGQEALLREAFRIGRGMTGPA